MHNSRENTPNSIMFDGHEKLKIEIHDLESSYISIHCFVLLNKLKSLKVAQVKDEMDDDEDDGCDGVCDVVW